MLVISCLLEKENTPSSASTIWSAWNPKNPEGVGKVASQSGGTLSLTGTIKICERLVSEGILVGISDQGYNNRTVRFYKLPAKGDQAPERGFLSVADRLRNSPFLLMDSKYGRSGIKDVLMKKVETDLGISLEDWKSPAAWTIARSPTAFALACDRDLNAGEVRKAEDQGERLRGFVAALHGAIAVDLASGYRGRLLAGDEQTREMAELLALGAHIAGKEDKDCLARLKQVRGKT